MKTWLVVIAILLMFGLSSASFINKNCLKDEECTIKAVKPLLLNHLAKKESNLCKICEEGIPLVKELIKLNDTKSFRAVATAVCVILNITQESICYQAVGLFENAVMDIIVNSPLNNQELCSIVLDCGPIKNPILNWNITLPNVPKPPFSPPKPPQPDAPKLRVLHISDLHIDFEYQPNSIGACGQPLCCRNSSTLANKSQELTSDMLAGYWGDYRDCDVPLWLVENLFEYISNNEQIDFVYWTGDLPPHNVWNQTKSDQLHAIQVLTSLFKKYFPKIPIYPTVGNHEATPVNLYPTPYVKDDSISWLYNQLAEDWTQTGVPEYAKQNISFGAYFSIPISPGLRLVSLNMNYCPTANFWLYINATDPLDQLAWLAQTLQQSETDGEKVHIIGHIHPDDCLDSWQDNFYRIITRYEATVTGLFFGHSHVDEFKILYDPQNKTRAYAISYISGSVTTYSYLNPNYRIYTIDGAYKGSTYQVLDHENIYMNLTDANLTMKPKWQKEYSAKEAFGLDSLYAEDWDKLITKMLNDLNGPLVDKLYRYSSKMSDAQDSCDLNCRKSFVCDYKQSRSSGTSSC